MPDMVGFFCVKTKLKFFYTAGELVMLLLSVDYLVPRKVKLHWCLVKALLQPSSHLTLHFHETFKEVAFLRVFSCLNFTITFRFLVKEGEWMQAQMNSIMS